MQGGDQGETFLEMSMINFVFFNDHFGCCLEERKQGESQRVKSGEEIISQGTEHIRHLPGMLLKVIL